MDIRVRRVYEPMAQDEGRRVLVDRLWPRGIARATLAGVPWLKEVAPSNELRAWFGHQPAKWAEFRRRYFAELDANPDAVAALRALLEPENRATLLFGARDEAHNNAVALREYLLREPH
jgi:uncharacterized protein YeaO (DUF488 family)